MNCDRVQRLLNAFVDGEVDLVTSLDIEEHLQGCPACSSQRQALENLRAATRSRALYYSAPAHLERRIRAALPSGTTAAPRRWTFSWRWLAPAFALIAILAFLAGFYGRGVYSPPTDALLAEQVQNAHIRSLMGDHLTDVVSTDQHTVKPWFNGKLDFSPPVPDLAAQGFPLIGGRLDYIDGRPVAALVYQRNKHVINVFIWPDSHPANAGVQSSTTNGYHLFHWEKNGMVFWAITDLNPDEMGGFIQLFRSNS